MQIDTRHLDSCLAAANEIADHYSEITLVRADPERSVDFLKLACEQARAVKINWLELDIQKDKSSVWGACVTKPDGFDICFVQGLNHCWKRFVLCKELFHVLLRDDEYMNMDIGGHVEEVTLTFPISDSKPGPSVVAEMVAQVGAMEFLFPYHRRVEAIARHAGEDPVNFRAIAEMYRVPQVYVEAYLAPGYMDVLAAHSRQTPPV